MKNKYIYIYILEKCKPLLEGKSTKITFFKTVMESTGLQESSVLQE